MLLLLNYFLNILPTSVGIIREINVGTLTLVYCAFVCPILEHSSMMYDLIIIIRASRRSKEFKGNLLSFVMSKWSWTILIMRTDYHY